ncbi:MAG: serine/threonine-protein kinase [Dehalococcoidia bacterium]
MVFEAVHPSYDRIALKLVHPSPGTAQQRALREIETAAKLLGPAFPRIHDWGQESFGRTPVIYVIEEFLDGGYLRTALNARGQIPLAEVLVLGDSLLEALVEVEAAHLVHRDIKPENIMLPSGRVVLIDFGIARHLDLASLTLDYVPNGPLTPGYAAPEQIRNEKGYITVRTDLFAIGVVLYECLTGRNPFLENCSSPAEALQRGLKLNPQPLTSLAPVVPPDLESFVHRCLSKAAHRRPPSAVDALDEIRERRAALTGP